MKYNDFDSYEDFEAYFINRASKLDVESPDINETVSFLKELQEIVNEFRDNKDSPIDCFLKNNIEIAKLIIISATRPEIKRFFKHGPFV